MKIKLQPIRTPNFIIQDTSAKPKEFGFQEAPKYSISELDAETLSDLCDEFRRNMFIKCGKPDPRINLEES